MEEKVKPSVARQGFGGECMSVCCFLERPLLEVVYRAEALRAKAGSIFDNRQLEVERELQLIYEIGGERSPP